MRTIFLLLLLSPLVCIAQTPLKKLPQKGRLNLLVHPSDLLVCEGMPVGFRAFAACPAPEVPQYQWQSSADGKNWDDIPGATSSSYDGIGLARRPHNGSQFRVRVSGAGETLWSVPAQLLVESGVYFTQKPEKQTVAEGASATLEARAETESGNGVASYQWQMSPYASGVWLPMPGENTPVLRLQNVTASMNGNSYRLLARTFNLCDSAVSAPAFLIVSGRPVVSITPLEKSLCGGGEAVFTVQLQGGSGKENCQWQRCKTVGGDFEDLPGETTFSLRLADITTAMNGQQFRARVKLGDGSVVTTPAAALTVHSNVNFSQQPRPVSVCMNEPASFGVAASYQGQTPDYQWQFSTGGEWQDIPGARTPRYEIPYATPDLDRRLFRARADVGICGAVFSESARLTVFTGLRFSRQPRDVSVSAVGSEAIFEADFEEQPGGSYSITWEWSANGGATWQFMPGGKGRTLTVAKTTEEMREYLFRMKVLDKTCGRITYSDPARVLF